jgi:hypothetical protein
MGRIRRPQPVKLFIGVLTSLPEILPEITRRLSLLFGPVDARSEAFPFDSTHYYDREMGSALRRYFLGFLNLICPDELGGIKVKTNEVEADLAALFSQPPRPANLDPGYLEQSKIILASTKNYYHRIYLSEGVYAEVTLHFEDGCWKELPWTFPDFRSGRYNSFFTALRKVYRAQLKP